MATYFPAERCSWPADFLRNREKDLKLWADSFKTYAYGLCKTSDRADDDCNLDHIANFLFRGEIQERHYKDTGGYVLIGILACLLERDDNEFPPELAAWMKEIGIAYALQIIDSKGLMGLEILEQLRSAEAQTDIATDILAIDGLHAIMRRAEEIYGNGYEARRAVIATGTGLSESTFEKALLRTIQRALQNDRTHLLLANSPSFRIRLSAVAEKITGQPNCEWFSQFNINGAVLMSISEQICELSTMQRFTDPHPELSMAIEEAKDWYVDKLAGADSGSTHELQIVEWINGTSQRPESSKEQRGWPYWKYVVVCIACQYQEIVSLRIDDRYQRVAALLRRCKADWYDREGKWPEWDPDDQEDTDREYGPELACFSGEIMICAEHEAVRSIEQQAFLIYEKRKEAEQHAAETMAGSRLPAAGVSEGQATRKRKIEVLDEVEAEEDKKVIGSWV
ncbi:hypothetical protein B0T11DRAFT_296828 [Plectosphaerella cucumerina]|uniref:Uncharacterized protein n=1 Tax=Plectosphaerella cucumerina TaxID=40658 RepID=A0A8K0X7E8_9PEZI|nr:hypothetical protein B0T11DRAFT_296828 [Plectosphaerella cucumerina]